MIWRLAMESILHFGVVIHIISMGGLVIFGLHRLWLLLCWFKIRDVQNGTAGSIDVDVPVFIFSGGAFLAYYLVFALSEKQTKGIWLIPFLPAFSIGLAPALALSVLKGFFINGGRFIRTPKFGITGNYPRQILVTDKLRQSSVYLIINLLCIGYTLSPVSLAFARGTWLALPFLLQFPLGFFVITWREINETLEFSRINKIRSHPPKNSTY